MMKKLYLFCLIAMFGLGGTLFASDSDLFSYDEEAVTTALSELTEIENYVMDNPSTSLSLMVENNNALVSGLDLFSPNAMGFAYGEPPLGIPSFLWGCVFGIVGVAIVYFVAEDSEETKKSFYGCIVSTLLYGVLYFTVLSTAEE
jgi:prolipoprotein diacylglyceryltransferase